MAISLRAARVNAELKQTEVIEKLAAQGIKITKNTLASYENYRTLPDVETAKALASLYDMSVDDIIFCK